MCFRSIFIVYCIDYNCEEIIFNLDILWSMKHLKSMLNAVKNRKSKQKCCRLSIYDVDRKAILQRKHAISLIEFGDPGGMLEGVAI